MVRRLPRVLPLLAIPAILGCSASADGSLSAIAVRLEAVTPEDQRAALHEDLEVLHRLDGDGALGRAERQALLDLFHSASRDGAVDEDERVLLARLVADLVAGGGSLAGPESPRTMEER